jgi:AraC-like DNA-binding protein
LDQDVDPIDMLRTLILRHAGPGPATPTLLQGVTLGVAHRSGIPRSGISEPSVAFVAQGAKRTVLNGRAYDYRAGQYLVVSINLPVIGHVLAATPDEPFVVVSLRLNPQTLAGLILESGSRTKAPSFSGMAVSDATPDLLDPVVRLLSLLDRPVDQPVLEAAYEREVLWRLLTGEQGAIVRQIALADGSLAHVARVIAWIRGHYSETLRLEQLASLAGMSVSSLHRHFRAATSMTPVQFQKQIRLQEARTLLLSGSPDIAEVGYLTGYDSPSQFSREYRRAFGQPPGRDALRLKEQDSLATA